MSNVIVRETVDTDLQAIAAVHKAQFGDHLLGQYSVSLLKKFYRSFLNNSIFLTAESSGEICGFILGGEESRLKIPKSQFVRSHFMRILLESVMRPKVWGIIARRVFGFKGGATKATSVYEMRLLSIAVTGSSKGKGVASALVSSFEKCLGDFRVYGLCVIVENSRAIAFYRKMGYSEEFRRGQSLYFFKQVPEGGANGSPST